MTHQSSKIPAQRLYSLIEQLTTEEKDITKKLAPDGANGVEWVDGEGGSESEIIVTQSSDFGVIDSSKSYLIDGIIDMTGVSIEVPSGGINLRGHNFNVSKLICNDSSYVLFMSPVGGSGSMLGSDYAIEVNGTNSMVYDLVADTGFEAFEFSRVYYNGCTSLGEVNGYRQGFESGTGRFGGSPELTLSGTWIGGYFIDTSIVRGLTDGSYSLFSAGAGFSMASRFRSNHNADLNSTISFIDFSASNFPNSSTIQLTGCLISRNGVFDASDTTLIPNIDQTELPSSWVGNIGLGNTFVGGSSIVNTEVTTSISSVGAFFVLDALWSTNDLVHFDNPANGQLRHLGVNPAEFKIYADFVIDGGANDELTLKAVKWDDSLSLFVDVSSQIRTVNNFQGGRDVAFFNSVVNVVLDQNDFIEFHISNNTDLTNVTLELESKFTVESR